MSKKTSSLLRNVSLGVVLAGGITLASVVPASAASWYNGATNCYNYQVMQWSTSTGTTTHAHEAPTGGSYYADWANGSTQTYRLSGFINSVKSNYVSTPGTLRSANRGCDH